MTLVLLTNCLQDSEYYATATNELYVLLSYYHPSHIYVDKIGNSAAVAQQVESTNHRLGGLIPVPPVHVKLSASAQSLHLNVHGLNPTNKFTNHHYTSSVCTFTCLVIACVFL